MHASFAAGLYVGVRCWCSRSGTPPDTRSLVSTFCPPACVEGLLLSQHHPLAGFPASVIVPAAPQTCSVLPCSTNNHNTFSTSQYPAASGHGAPGCSSARRIAVNQIIDFDRTKSQDRFREQKCARFHKMIQQSCAIIRTCPNSHASAS